MPASFDIERLVKQVTDLVLARLQPAPAAGAARRRLDLLLPMQTAHIDALIAQLDRIGTAGAEVTVRTTARVLAWLERTGRRQRLGPRVVALDEACLCESLGDYGPGDVVVVGAIGFGLLDRLVGLADDDPFVRLVSQALLRGVLVLVATDDLAPAGPQLHHPLAGRAEQALVAVRRLGVEPQPIAAMAGRLDRSRAADNSLSRAIGGLLSEADVERLVAAGQRSLALAGGAIVTPLARSRAVALGLELVEDSGE